MRRSPGCSAIKEKTVIWPRRISVVDRSEFPDWSSSHALKDGRWLSPIRPAPSRLSQTHRTLRFAAMKTWVEASAA